MKVNSRVKLNMSRIKQLSRAQVTALEQTAEAVQKEVVQAQVVPFEKGTLQGESFFVDNSEAKSGKVTLVHNTPYARKLYFHPEYNFSTEENPNAKGKWFEDWEPGGAEQDFALKVFKKLYRRLTGV